jgi:hypothetical protein
VHLKVLINMKTLVMCLIVINIIITGKYINI